MSKPRDDRRALSASDPESRPLTIVARSRTTLWAVSGTALVLLLALGVFAKNGWLPSTDPFTGKKTGWFGAPVAKNASSSWNPLAAPLPTPIPQLSREYLYAGSRLLGVVDANAQEAPPADLAVWRPSSGVWWVMGPGGTQQATQAWGVSGDVPVPGDYDGDGKTDFSVFRPSTGTWYIVNSSTGGTGEFPFGSSGDIPAQADYDGDGKTDAAVFRPSNANWYILQSSGAGTITSQFGLGSDLPAPADYDGDGRADIGVWRGSNTAFYSVNSSNGLLQTPTLGQSGDKVVSADYDGDGKADYAIYNTTSANWHIRQSTTGTLMPNAQWGSAGSSGCTGGSCPGEVPVQNDYDGDGKVDLATWRDSNGRWYIRQSASANSLRQVQWGVSGDIPVPAYYRR